MSNFSFEFEKITALIILNYNKVIMLCRFLIANLIA